MRTKSILRQNKKPLITKVDKGNSTLVINKESYVEQIEDQLQDKKYYEQVQKNPLPKLKDTNLLIKKF